jgi:hypothetical protein
MPDVWLDIPAIMRRVRMGEIEGLEEVGDRVAVDAKRRAPIRKVFREKPGFRRKFRPLDRAQRALAIRRANAYYGPGGFKARLSQLSAKQRAKARFNYSHAEVSRKGSMNSLAASRQLRLLGIERNGRFTSPSGNVRTRRGVEPSASLKQKLSSRGLYEVRSGRAIHREPGASGTRVMAGGALKASIGSEGAVEMPHGATVTVSARIRYAKFVEFPTIHNAAQPFLRPALYAERSKVKATLAAAIRRTLGG